VVLVSATACGGSSSAPTASAAPALQPSGGSARSIDYRCVHGRLGAIALSVPDLRKLAESLNPVNVCEYDGGLAEVTLTVNCDNGSPARVSLRAVGGKLPATASASC
jgi:hypothetical protein